MTRYRIVALSAAVLLLACRTTKKEAPGTPGPTPVPPGGVATENPPPPAETPPAGPPAESVPPPPASAAPAPAPQAPPPGQWVYTQQYGWLWMPHADAYAYVPPDGYGEPYAYAYYPAYGWAWLPAPWIWGYGPWPYFGVYGAVSFGWYGHGWWRHPRHWHYAPGVPARGAPGPIVRPSPRGAAPAGGSTGSAPAPRRPRPR